MRAIAAIATAAGLLVPIADGPAPTTIDNAGRRMRPPPPAIASMNPARRAALKRRSSVTDEKLPSARPEAKIRDAHQAPRVLLLPAAISSAPASQRVHRVRQAAPGAIRSAENREVHDEADAVRACLDDVAVSRSAAGKTRGEHGLARGRVDAAYPRALAWRVAENG